MGIIFSNMPLTKETSEKTILQMFINKEATLTIRDYTTLIYFNKNKLYREFEFVLNNQREYEIKLMPVVNNSGTILGLHFAEGHNVRVKAKKEPVFAQKQSNLDIDLKGFLDPANKMTSSVVGIYHLGSKVYYKKDGVPYCDELTKNGWKISVDNNSNGIESVSDVAEKVKQKKALSFSEKKELAQHLLDKKEITEDLYRRYMVHIGEKSKLDINFVTIEEIKLLKEKGL